MSYMTHISQGAKTYGQRVPCNANTGDCPNGGHAQFADKETYDAYRALSSSRESVRELLEYHGAALDSNTMRELSDWKNSNDPTMDPRSLINHPETHCSLDSARSHCDEAKSILDKGMKQVEEYEARRSATERGSAGLRKGNTGGVKDGESGYNLTGDNSWVNQAKADIPQWREAAPYMMNKWGKPVLDENGNKQYINWDTLSKLDYVKGIGVGSDYPDPEKGLAMDAARQDYAHKVYETMDYVFQHDTEHRIESFRTGLMLAYGNRRLTDEVDVLAKRIQERDGLDEPPLSPLQQREKADGDKYWAERKAREAKVAEAKANGTWEPAPPDSWEAQKAERDRLNDMSYFPGRNTGEVIGTDIETASTGGLRFPAGDMATISNIGFARTNLSVPEDELPEPDGTTGEKEWDETLKGNYGIEKYDFGGSKDRVEAGNTYEEYTQIPTAELTKHKPLDEDRRMQRLILDRLTSAPVVTHNGSFEDSHFTATIPGYAEAKRDGRIVLIDTMMISRQWDTASKDRQTNPDMKRNTLEAMANRHGKMPSGGRQENGVIKERHVGLQDTLIMNNTLRECYRQMRETGTGSFGPDGRKGIGGHSFGVFAKQTNS